MLVLLLIAVIAFVGYRLIRVQSVRLQLDVLNTIANGWDVLSREQKIARLQKAKPHLEERLRALHPDEDEDAIEEGAGLALRQLLDASGAELAEILTNKWSRDR